LVWIVWTDRLALTTQGLVPMRQRRPVTDRSNAPRPLFFGSGLNSWCATLRRALSPPVGQRMSATRNHRGAPDQCVAWRGDGRMTKAERTMAPLVFGTLGIPPEVVASAAKAAGGSG